MKYELNDNQVALIQEMLASAESNSHNLSLSEQFRDEDEEIGTEKERVNALNELVDLFAVETY